MALTLKDTIGVMVEGNKGAAKASAKRRAGNMLNDRIVGMISPKLPYMARGYAESPLGKALIANAVAGAIVHFGYTNEKLMLASDAMVTAAMDQFIGSFNLEEMINELVDGIDLSSVKDTGDDIRGAAGAVLRKASDVVTPDDEEAVASGGN